MGYTKSVVYGNTVEIYKYEKDFIYHRKKTESKLSRNRRKNRKKIKTQRSIKRARTNFFRLVHHNNVRSDTIHLITLTFAVDVKYTTALQAQKDFLKKIRKHYESEKSPISYISVPELTKKGRWHFHILVYGLPSYVTKQSERLTRDIQRLYCRGYIHIDLARDRSPKIAGYMAKYLAKSLSDERPESGRSYNCSRNIKKISSYGTNESDFFPNLTYPIESVTEYPTKYLGNCTKTVYNVDIKKE